LSGFEEVVVLGLTGAVLVFLAFSFCCLACSLKAFSLFNFSVISVL
jgi:hypothetical protein